MSYFTLPLALLVVCGVPVYAQKSGTVRQQIEANYRREGQALARENVAGVLAHYARDYEYRGPQGQRYKMPQLHAVLASMFADMSAIRSTTRILYTAPARGGTKVSVRERLEARLNTKKRKNVKLVIDELREDFWRPAGSTFVKARSRSISQTESLNGRLVTRRPK